MPYFKSIQDELKLEKCNKLKQLLKYDLARDYFLTQSENKLNKLKEYIKNEYDQTITEFCEKNDLLKLLTSENITKHRIQNLQYILIGKNEENINGTSIRLNLLDKNFLLLSHGKDLHNFIENEDFFGKNNKERLKNYKLYFHNTEAGTFARVVRNDYSFAGGSNNIDNECMSLISYLRRKTKIINRYTLDYQAYYDESIVSDKKETELQRQEERQQQRDAEDHIRSENMWKAFKIDFQQKNTASAKQAPPAPPEAGNATSAKQASSALTLSNQSQVATKEPINIEISDIPHLLSSLSLSNDRLSKGLLHNIDTFVKINQPKIDSIFNYVTGTIEQYNPDCLSNLSKVIFLRNMEITDPDSKSTNKQLKQITDNIIKETINTLITPHNKIHLDQIKSSILLLRLVKDSQLPDNIKEISDEYSKVLKLCETNKIDMKENVSDILKNVNESNQQITSLKITTLEIKPLEIKHIPDAEIIDPANKLTKMMINADYVSDTIEKLNNQYQINECIHNKKLTLYIKLKNNGDSGFTFMQKKLQELLSNLIDSSDGCKKILNNDRISYNISDKNKLLPKRDKRGENITHYEFIYTINIRQLLEENPDPTKLKRIVLKLLKDNCEPFIEKIIPLLLGTINDSFNVNEACIEALKKEKEKVKLENKYLKYKEKYLKLKNKLDQIKN